MNLDLKVLGREAFDHARKLLEPKAKALGERGKILLAKFERLERDTTRTLEDLAAATSTSDAEALRQDLEITLPARRAMLLAAVEAELGSAEKALLDAAIDVGVRVALAVARALLPIP